MAKVYLATSLGNREIFAAVRARLEMRGDSLSFDWTAGIDPTGRDVVYSDGRVNVAEMRRRARLEKQGVQEADVVVAIYPAGRGTQREIGMAVAWMKPVLILGSLHDLMTPYPCTFDYLDGISILDKEDPRSYPDVVAKWLDVVNP